jgi:hypothetical protein
MSTGQPMPSTSSAAQLPAPFGHEIRRKLAEFFQQMIQPPTRGSDAEFIADALDFQVKIGTLEGKFGWNSHRVRVAVLKDPRIRQDEPHVCTRA